jgi:hypothetical protein
MSVEHRAATSSPSPGPPGEGRGEGSSSSARNTSIRQNPHPNPLPSEWERRKGRRGKVIVFGILFWYPLAGVTWQFLHYLLALRRLGYDVYYVEDSGRYVYDPGLNDMSPDATPNIRAIAPILDRHGFESRWAFRGVYPGGKCYGMTEEQILRLYREADAFLNVTGAQEIRDEHLTVPRRIYVESDPVASQIKIAQNDPATLTILDAHDAHFSYGENFYHDDCRVPLSRYKWLPTRQPVALDLWDNPHLPDRSAAYNTITTWENRGKDIEWDGQTYRWSKHHEFIKIIDLPKRRPNAAFELAAGVDADVKKLLSDNGWRNVDSVAISRDVERYRDYIQQSRGEFTVAKDQNIRLRSGWFSDRSACYLAAGRPVINQDTAFARVLPTGKGLHSFRTMDDILAAVDAIESDYEGNCRAAREIAAEYFDAEKVVGSLMKRAGLL